MIQIELNQEELQMLLVEAQIKRESYLARIRRSIQDKVNLLEGIEKIELDIISDQANLKRKEELIEKLELLSKNSQKGEVI